MIMLAWSEIHFNMWKENVKTWTNLLIKCHIFACAIAQLYVTHYPFLGCHTVWCYSLYYPVMSHFIHNKIGANRKWNLKINEDKYRSVFIIGINISRETMLWVVYVSLRVLGPFNLQYACYYNEWFNNRLSKMLK